jgi:hypothetical protein
LYKSEDNFCATEMAFRTATKKNIKHLFTSCLIIQISIIRLVIINRITKIYNAGWQFCRKIHGLMGKMLLYKVIQNFEGS